MRKNAVAPLVTGGESLGVTPTAVMVYAFVR